MQHAQGARPDPSHGYCTDDVARALMVDLLHQRELGWGAIEPSIARNVTFLAEAFNESTGRFRNLRRWDGAWLDSLGSEDANARALQALGEVIASAPAGTVRDDAAAVFERALPSASRASSLRPRAAVILACDWAARAGMFDEVAGIYQRVANDLWQTFDGCQADAAWPWPEAIVTYENELPAQALIVAGRRLDRPDMVRTGLRVLDWLIDAQTAADGQLRSVGNAGWWPGAVIRLGSTSKPSRPRPFCSPLRPRSRRPATRATGMPWSPPMAGSWVATMPTLRSPTRHRARAPTASVRRASAATRGPNPR